MTHQPDHESTAGKAAVLRDFVSQLTDRLADCCTECDACAVIARDLADAELRRVTDDPAPAAVSVAVGPPTTHGLSIPHSKALYDAIATPGPGEPESFDDQHARVCAVVRQIRDELLPAPVDRAAVLREVADELTRKANKLTERVHDLAYFVAKDRLREAEILDREATALRCMADETAAETPAPACAHCGQPISHVTGTLTAWWVHDPGGNTLCHPEHAARSHRATPQATSQPPAGARQDGTQPCAECGDPKTTHREGDDPVSPGHCTACPHDDAWHDYRPAHQNGTQS